MQWHLETQAKNFISRLGAPIYNLSLSEVFYSVLLGDNSVKVVRFDNNKVKVHIKGAQFENEDIISSDNMQFNDD